VRELERDLARAGFAKTAARGSHRRWRHARGVAVIISGKGGDDAKPYQEREVAEAIARATARR
jgi:predicted RNA binding protein YcfA (HicA-like mRNA interferase family)